MGNAISINSWEDVVFEDRNKDYGAYSLITLFLSVMVVYAVFKEKHAQVTDTTSVIAIPRHITIIPAPPIDKPVSPQKATAVTHVKVDNVLPLITAEDVDEKDEMLSNEQVEQILNVSYTDFKTAGGADYGSTIEIIQPAAPIEEPAATPATEPAAIVRSPEFSGGDRALVKWLAAHLNYPAMAQRMGIEGQVVVEFTVGMDGRVADATVVKSLHKLCDEEAIRLVKSMPVWKPGESNGAKVVARRTLPIRFVLR
jgi:periplasmic protein TonB